jgi:hypothetical protein
VSWRVRADAVGTGPLDRSTILFVRDAVHKLGILVHFDRNSLTIKLTVQADSAAEAAQTAMERVRSVFPPSVPLQPVRLYIDEVGSPSEQPSEQDLLGIAELAMMLDVTKQRASDLARNPDFPRPLQELKAGPVWARSSIARYLKTWDRRPGRPARRAKAA